MSRVRLLMVVTASVWLLAARVQAQLYALQAADPVDAMQPDRLTGTVGISFSDDEAHHGLRLSWDIPRHVRLFLGTGIGDRVDTDSFMSVSGGLLLRLTTASRADFGVRLAGYHTLSSEPEITGGNLLGMVGYQSRNVGALRVYGGLGVDANDEDSLFLGTLGLSLRVTRRGALYGELTSLDSMFFGAGVSFDL